MRFSRLIQGELPFTLNIPSGTYPVNPAGTAYLLELLQEQIGVAVNAKEMMVDTVEKVRKALGERWETTYKHELRTLVRHTDEVTVTPDQLVKPTDEDHFSAMQTAILIRDHPNYSEDKHQLQVDARAALDAMSEEQRQAFVEDTTIRMTADRLFPHGDVATFCKAVNALIRLYMTTFGDFFVEEVLPQHFSNTAFRGLHLSWYYNGVCLRNCRDAGGRFPFILRRPWFTHHEPDIQRFRDSLQHAVEPDPVALLGIRARAFLMRGAYRSAINEASAALDLSVTRRIGAGLAAQGKSQEEIDSELKSSIRFEDRAKKMLKNATGKSGPEVDPVLWEKVTKHHKLRTGVAHANAEPSVEQATQAVEDMLTLANMIDAI